MTALTLPDRQPFSLYLARDANEIAKKRAAHKCERCGGVGPCGLVMTHHKFSIKGLPRSFNLFNHPSNLEVLCPSCHARIHKFGRWGVGNP